MAYRIVSIERIDAASLAEPLPAGHARYRALVEIWDGPAIGPPHIVDDFILQRPTQYMRPAAGDDWELVPKHEALIDYLTDLIELTADEYKKQIRAGERGFRGDQKDKHGVAIDDPITRHAAIKKIVNVVRETRGR